MRCSRTRPMGAWLAVRAAGSLACSGLLVAGEPTFDVVPKHRAVLDEPFAPGARVELALWSNERAYVGPAVPPVLNVRGTTTDAGVATFGQLHDMGYTNGFGDDITGEGITAVGPGTAQVCVTGDLRRGSHTECMDIEVRAATWTYLHEGKPLTGDLEVPRGEKVRLALRAEDANGGRLVVFGAYFDDDFAWASLGGSSSVGGGATCSGTELKLAKSPHRVRCVEP